MSVLIVDDEDDSRSLLDGILTSEGLAVHAADSGGLALASLSVRVPELMLVDVRMPGMDGFEFCRRVKARDDLRDIPLIFLSASVNLADRLKGFRLGAVDFIAKPFQREELLARVRTHLELARLRTQLEGRVAERTARLRESEERFRAMADAAPVMIWATGVDKGCQFLNRRWLEFTGRSLEEEVGTGWAAGVHPDDRERCWQMYSTAFENREIFETEYRVRRHDGEYRWLLDRGAPRTLPDGSFSGYVGSCFDITEIKQANQRMLASQKFESLGVMAAGVAHDFDNLLATVVAEADAAISEVPPDCPVQSNLERIAAVASRGSEIVQMLMDFVGAGKGAAALAPLNLSSVVEDLLRLLAPSLSRSAEVRIGLRKDVPPVLGNAAQLQQVVLNLVKNASEALGGQHGSITISTERAGLASDINALGLPAGDYVRLIVGDTGCGMSAEACARIFDPFFTTKPTGRGLGLAAVQGIVRSHGGAISVESKPGEGTTFEIWLPEAASAVLRACSCSC